MWGLIFYTACHLQVQRHFDELNKTRDALLEKLRLKNANMKNMARKLEAHMRQKEEMGEVMIHLNPECLLLNNVTSKI